MVLGSPRVLPGGKRSVVRYSAMALGAFVAFLLAGNLIIFGFTTWARHSVAAGPAATAGKVINNFRAVDEHLYRGAAPGRDGYAALADMGITTVVDLRAEEYVNVDEAYLNSLGLTLVRIPIRDGQTPTEDEIAKFLSVVEGTGEKVFVHCGAGVGRTGAMVATYLVATGASPSEALRRNLSVGPPSLEQIAFAAGLEPTDMERPNAAVVAISRVLDAPRRTWARLSH